MGAILHPVTGGRNTLSTAKSLEAGVG